MATVLMRSSVGGVEGGNGSIWQILLLSLSSSSQQNQVRIQNTQFGKHLLSTLFFVVRRIVQQNYSSKIIYIYIYIKQTYKVSFLEHLHIFLSIKSDNFAIPFILKYFRKVYTFSFYSKCVFRANQYHLLVMTAQQLSAES